MRHTVLGAHGYVGRALAQHLQSLGHEVQALGRNWREALGQDWGVVHHCVGLTANFRQHPLATVEAHVGMLHDVLSQARFDRLVYLSSCRVYCGATSTDEATILRVAADKADYLYNLSKLMGESLALHSGRPCTVVRLSNVIGPCMAPVNLLGTVLQEARQAGQVRLQTALSSAKDYVWLDDVVQGLSRLALVGESAIYNLASGVNTTHGELAQTLEALGIKVSVVDDAPEVQIPAISMQRLHSILAWQPRPVGPELMAWLHAELVAPF